MSEIPVTEDPLHVALNTFNLIEAEKNKTAKISLLNSLKENEIARWFFLIDCPANRRLGIRVCDENARIYAGTAKPAEMNTRFDRFRVLVNSLLQADVNKATTKEEIEKLLQECSYTDLFREGVWYTRLINHGMRLSLPAKAIAECWPELRITSTMPYARSVLNADGSVSQRKLQQIGMPCVAEPIIGGVLASIIVAGDDSHVTAFGGRVLPVAQAWADLARKALGEDVPKIVINGEFVADCLAEGSPYRSQKERAAQICREGIHCTSDVCKKSALSELTFVAYDVFTVASMTTGMFKVPYGHSGEKTMCRSTIVSGLVKRCQSISPDVRMEVAQQSLCHDISDVELAHRQHRRSGSAGTIIKPCAAFVRFEPSDGLFKWKEIRTHVGYILSVYNIKDTVGIEVFVPETNATQHVSVPTRPLEEWFRTHMNSLDGYAVEYTEVHRPDSRPLCILKKLRADKDPISGVQMAALGNKFGIATMTKAERISLNQFSKAAAFLSPADEGIYED